jgi:hypothetical protein
MNNITSIGPGDTDRLLAALGDQVLARGEQYSLVVVGGSALLAVGLLLRATRDVDVVALHDKGDLFSAEQLPDGLMRAAEVVAADFGLPPDWLNSGPASLLRWGLPEGFLERATHRDYGSALDVRFASRLDQIHLKLYAVVDLGAGRHLDDLRALQPSEAELLSAARWSRGHDPSPGYHEVLCEVLAHFGVDRVP